MIARLNRTTGDWVLTGGTMGGSGGLMTVENDRHEVHFLKETSSATQESRQSSDDVDTSSAIQTIDYVFVQEVDSSGDWSATTQRKTVTDKVFDATHTIDGELHSKSYTNYGGTAMLTGVVDNESHEKYSGTFSRTTVTDYVDPSKTGTTWNSDGNYSSNVTEHSAGYSYGYAYPDNALTLYNSTIVDKEVRETIHLATDSDGGAEGEHDLFRHEQVNSNGNTQPIIHIESSQSAADGEFEPCYTWVTQPYGPATLYVYPDSTFTVDMTFRTASSLAPLDAAGDEGVPILAGPTTPEGKEGDIYIPPSVVGEVCLPAGEMVTLTDGVCKAVDKLNKGEEVLVPDQGDPEGAKKRCKITEIYHNAPQPILTLKLQHQTSGCEFEVHSTPGHRFYVRNFGFKHAESIAIGSELLNGNQESVILLSAELAPTPVQVYNFKVEDAHTYFVGKTAELSVLSHNQGCNHVKKPSLPSLSPLRNPDFSNINWKGNWTEAEKTRIKNALSLLRDRLPKLLDDVKTAESKLKPEDYQKVKTALKKYEKVLNGVVRFIDGDYSLEFKQWPEIGGPGGRYYFFQGMVYLNSGGNDMMNWNNISDQELAALLFHEISHGLWTRDDDWAGPLYNAHKIATVGRLWSDGHLVNSPAFRDLFKNPPAYLSPKN